MNHLPLHDEFVKRHATLMPFADWEVPAYFTSILDEHATVRNAAGIFDISHMGVLSISGTDATRYLNYVTTNNCAQLANGKALYSLLLNERGGIVDDIFIYRESETLYTLVVNASNCAKDFAWLSAHVKDFAVSVVNRSPECAIFALQGPASGMIIKHAFNFDLGSMPFHTFRTISFQGKNIMLATTGYTGEWGCEMVFDRTAARVVWDALFQAGAAVGLKPIGFGARDTLRLEACCVLYGNEMNEDITPLEAELAWVVKWDKGDFIGKAALEAQQKKGITRRLVAFEMIDRGIPRHEYPVMFQGARIGTVTSGGCAPTVGKNIGLGYVLSSYGTVGTEIDIDIRGRMQKARIVNKPFYRRNKLRDAHYVHEEKK